MFGSILHRTILMELVKVFVLSLVGITGILLLAGIVSEATQHGLGPGQVLAVIPFIIPSTLPYTIPATTLFATCIVYGRLAQDNEIIALKAAGVHLFKVVWPGVLLGIVMSGVTLGLYYQTIPATHRAMRTMFLNDVEELLYSMLRRDRCINQPKLNYVIFVTGVQGRKLQNPVFKRRVGTGFDVEATADEAELRVDLPRKQILVDMTHCYVLGNGKTAFCENKIFDVPMPEDFGMDKKTRPSDLTWAEIRDLKKSLQREMDQLGTAAALAKAGRTIFAPTVDLPKHIRDLGAIVRSKEYEIYSLDTELYMRPALALGCLCFVLIGCPVGIWFSRSDYLSAFITCFLPIVFVYYPILLCGTNFAKSGSISPALSMWAANGVVAAVAAVLFRRLLRN